jgi:hypothetical protein
MDINVNSGKNSSQVFWFNLFFFPRQTIVCHTNAVLTTDVCCLVVDNIAEIGKRYMTLR